MNQALSFPKGIISKIRGQCIVIQGNDIDTDRIIPARFLKCVSFESLGENVFADDRTELKGSHSFDLEENKGASILIVNQNFGCGSSREHAPQALMRWGIRAVIGQSFGEIFHGNCLAIGIPCATAAAEVISELQKIVIMNQNKAWTLDLNKLLISNDIKDWKVNIKAGPLEMLKTGHWDATRRLMHNDKELTRTMESLPYLKGFNDGVKMKSNRI